MASKKPALGDNVADKLDMSDLFRSTEPKESRHQPEHLSSRIEVEGNVLHGEGNDAPAPSVNVEHTGPVIQEMQKKQPFISTSFKLSEEILIRLRVYCATYRKKLGAVVEHAIREYLDRQISR